jgi:hypothetical protein
MTDLVALAIPAISGLLFLYWSFWSFPFFSGSTHVSHLSSLSYRGMISLWPTFQFILWIFVNIDLAKKVTLIVTGICCILYFFI